MNRYERRSYEWALVYSTNGYADQRTIGRAHASKQLST